MCRLPRPRCAAVIKLFERLQHSDDVFTRHAGAGSAADRENDSFATRTFEDVESLFLDFLGSAAYSDLQRIHIAHETHAAADAPLHFANVFLLAPIEHV